MRTIWLLAGMALWFITAGPLAAQNLLGSTPQFQFQPIDTSKALKPPSLSNFNNGGFRLRNPSLSFPSLSLTPGRWPASGISSPVLTGSKNLFQPNPPKGLNPFAPRTK